MSFFSNIVIPRKDRVFIVKGEFEYDGHMFVYPNARERKMSLFYTKDIGGAVVVTVRDKNLMKKLQTEVEGKVKQTVHFEDTDGFGMYSHSDDEIEHMVHAVHQIMM